jgi:hypothetical protein
MNECGSKYRRFRVGLELTLSLWNPRNRFSTSQSAPSEATRRRNLGNLSSTYNDAIVIAPEPGLQLRWRRNVLIRRVGQTYRPSKEDPGFALGRIRPSLADDYGHGNDGKYRTW